MIVFIVWTESSLHKPMYSFISNLMICEIFGSTSYLFKLMIDLLSGSTTISYYGCLLQAFCVQTYAFVEMLTFTIMAHDRYLAVGHPLRYPTLMANNRALQWIGFIWIFIIAFQFVVVILAAEYTMCGVTINNVYCETTSLLNLACGNRFINNIYGATMIVTMICFSQLIILHSYIRTFMICLKMSRVAFQKAIHTLVTHLITFSSFMIGLVFVTFRYRLNAGDVSHLVHLAVATVGVTITLIINPFVYGLRTEALRTKLFYYVHKAVSENNPPYYQAVSENNPPYYQAVSENNPPYYQAVSENNPPYYQAVSENNPHYYQAVSENNPPYYQAVSEKWPPR
ncbi:olfactory receptor 1500-like [Pelodytes ibericus]